LRCSLVILFLLSATLAHAATTQPVKIVVSSKTFTESVILGEIASQLARSTGANATHNRQLGGTRLVFNALVRGEVDIYPEYTGTIVQEILAQKGGDVREALAAQGIVMTPPLGFNNTYAIGMQKAVAQRLGINTISDLKNHPQLRIGFSNEFMDRRDGWPALRDAYQLPQKDVRGLDHDLAYRALTGGSIDATDLYSTDAEIVYYDLHVLTDDQRHFPEYQAVFLYRTDLTHRAPQVIEAINRITGRISERDMINMNAQAKLKRVPEDRVASDFLASSLNIRSTSTASSTTVEILNRTAEHLFLVCVSLAAAMAVAIPLGILAFKQARLGHVILSSVAAIYTIPSLALLVFMIPLLGIGAWPAIVALFLYSLLPIVRNTHAGLTGIPQPIRESAEVLGLPPRKRLAWIELPMATPAILAGIKTAAVINVGTATLGALIGAGGYGQPIITGIRLDNLALILQGAIPAALLALLVQGAFESAERLLIPRGLRIQRIR
jgi:osmoprotectant transport system permease protein